MAGELYPLHVKDAGFTPPEDPTYFLVSADGLHMVRRTPLYSSCVPVQGGVPGLEPQAPHCELHFPPVPSDIVEQAVTFFRTCYDRWRAEGVVILFYAPPREDRPARFALEAPPQRIPGWYDSRGRFTASLRLDYGACERPDPSFVKLGTFHSHAELAAGHSCTDVADESNETGLHLTAGYVDRAQPEFSASFVVGGTRFRVTPERAMEPYRRPRPFPPRWLDQITLERASWSTAPAYTGNGAS